MISEDKKYLSSIFRNLGFAPLAPIGSIAFQFLVFDKEFSTLKVALCLFVSLLSWLSFHIGYNYVKEKRNDRA